MTTPSTIEDPRDHFAHCVQVFGGVTPTARRLGIDERAIRRFVNGELVVSDRLLQDTATALRVLIAEATAAQEYIDTMAGSAPNA